MGCLTTHVLDTANGCPAANISIELYRLADERILLKQSMTNADGRLDKPLLDDDTFSSGRYELVFHVAEYFTASGLVLPDPPFLEQVVMRFGVSDQSQHYHVPLLLSPWSYSTYRGS